MLKHRVLTALVLVPVVVWGIFSLSPDSFAVVCAAIILLGAHEWGHLSGLKAYWQRSAWLLFVTFGMMGAWWLSAQLSVVWLLLPAAVWWLSMLIWVFRRAHGTEGIGAPWPPLLRLFGGALTLIPAWLALITLHSIDGHGATLVLYILILVWVADTGAYFAGKRFGRHKLAPNLSPGKTMEGLGGAFAATVVLGLVAAFALEIAEGHWLSFLLITLVVMGFSVLGDLVESVIKRQAGAKDSGRILPGHGGVLDRIDSITSAAPLFVIGLSVAGILP